MFAELSIDSRVDSAKTTDDERQAFTDSAVYKAAENRSDEAVNCSVNINLGSSQYEADSSQYEPDSQPVSTVSSSAPLSPGSASIRHSVSDSLVYHAEVEPAASSSQVLADCPSTEQVDSSAGLNGYCPAVEETCMSQARMVKIDKF